MAMMKIKLVGCDRYGFKGQGYERGKVYVMPEAKARILLNKVDEYKRPYFAEHVQESQKSREERIAEAAARAAAAEARRQTLEEIVDMSGESADAEKYEVTETGDPDVQELDVDTDDDPSLDEADEPNPEEVVEDRADGSEVAV